MTPAPLTPSQSRTLAAIEAELGRLIRYDDESVVHDAWIRQRYVGGFAASYATGRSAAAVTAWHEAGHAVAALAVGARFSSASIRGSAGWLGACWCTRVTCRTRSPRPSPACPPDHETVGGSGNCGYVRNDGFDFSGAGHGGASGRQR